MLSKELTIALDAVTKAAIALVAMGTFWGFVALIDSWVCNRRLQRQHRLELRSEFYNEAVEVGRETTDSHSAL